jgi:hypothetical protein
MKQRLAQRRRRAGIARQRRHLAVPALDQEAVARARHARREARVAEHPGAGDALARHVAEPRELDQPRAARGVREKLAPLLPRVHRRGGRRVRGHDRQAPRARDVLQRTCQRPHDAFHPCAQPARARPRVQDQRVEADHVAVRARPQRARVRRSLGARPLRVAGKEVDVPGLGALAAKVPDHRGHRRARQARPLVHDRVAHAARRGPVARQRKPPLEGRPHRAHGARGRIAHGGRDHRAQAGADAAQPDHAAAAEVLVGHEPGRRHEVGLGVQRIEGVALGLPDVERFARQQLLARVQQLRRLRKGALESAEPRRRAAPRQRHRQRRRRSHGRRRLALVAAAGGVEPGVGRALPQFARLDQRLGQQRMARDAARQRVQCIGHRAQPLELVRGRLAPHGVAEDEHHVSRGWR